MEIKKENLKENYIKNIEKLNKIEKEIVKATNEENIKKQEIEENTDKFLNETIEKNEFLQIEAQKRLEKKKKEAKKQVLQIEKGLILNNLYNLINFDFKKIIYNDIFYKYTSKNIGDKTKEKIFNEVKDYFKNNYNIDVYFYFIRNYNCNGFLYDIDFKIALIDTQKQYNNKILEYSTCLYMDGATEYHINDLLKVKYNNENGHFIYNYDENFIYNIIDNTEEEAKKIYTTSKKLNKKIDKLLKEFETLKKENNALFKNNLYDFKNLYINTYLK